MYLLYEVSLNCLSTDSTLCGDKKIFSLVAAKHNVLSKFITNYIRTQ